MGSFEVARGGINEFRYHRPFRAAAAIGRRRPTGHDPATAGTTDSSEPPPLSVPLQEPRATTARSSKFNSNPNAPDSNPNAPSPRKSALSAGYAGPGPRRRLLERRSAGPQAAASGPMGPDRTGSVSDRRPLRKLAAVFVLQPYRYTKFSGFRIGVCWRRFRGRDASILQPSSGGAQIRGRGRLGSGVHDGFSPACLPTARLEAGAAARTPRLAGRGLPAKSLLMRLEER